MIRLPISFGGMGMNDDKGEGTQQLDSILSREWHDTKAITNVYIMLESIITIWCRSKGVK